MTAERETIPDDGIFFTHEEGWQILEENAQRYLGMSADQFLRAWRAGEIEQPDRPEVMRVVSLLSLAR